MSKTITTSTKTVMNIKIDRGVKEKAQAISKELGLPLSTLIGAYLRDFTRTKEVHFSIEPVPNAATAKRWQEASEDIRAGRNLSPAFKSAKEAEAWLNA
jgi:addiction module RelB/DinJ family antitoxin